MTNYLAKTVSGYISSAPKEARSHLREIQAGIKYSKPYYNYHGMLAGFDAYKDQIGFEIWADKLESEHTQKLKRKGYKTGRRTFQITYDQKVPSAIIKKMVKVLASVNEAKSKKK